MATIIYCEWESGVIAALTGRLPRALAGLTVEILTGSAPDTINLADERAPLAALERACATSDTDLIYHILARIRKCQYEPRDYFDVVACCWSQHNNELVQQILERHLSGCGCGSRYSVLRHHEATNLLASARIVFSRPRL